MRYRRENDGETRLWHGGFIVARYSDQPSDKLPPGHDSSVHEFLTQLHRQLDQIEQELAGREARLAEGQLQLEQERTRLQNEQAAWTAWQKREQDLAAKFEEAAKRLTAGESLLKDRDEQLRIFAGKNQELRGQLAELTRQRDEAQARVAEIQEQAEVQARRAAGLEKQVAALKAASVAAPQRARSEPAPSPARRRPQVESPDMAAGVGETTSTSPLLIALGIAAVVLSAALGVWAYSSYTPLCSVSGHVRTRPGDESTLSECAQQARSAGLSVTEIDVDRGLLTFGLDTHDVEPAIERINHTGRQMVALLQTATLAPASQAVPSPARDAALERISRIDQRLATTTRPSFDRKGEGSRLVALWNAAETERREIDASLASLSEASGGSTIDPASVRIDPEEIRAAENADTMLKTEVEALRQRESELSDMLRRIVAGGDTTFKSLNQALGEGVARLDRALKEEYGVRIREGLQTLKQTLGAWEQASKSLSADWAVQRDALAGGADLLTCQTQLDQGARHFVDTGSASLVQFRQRLEAIGQDTDEPTKGLVLSRALTKDLQPAVDAQLEATRVARSATLNGNVDLAAAVQRVSALRRQVGDRRSRIEAAIRARIAAGLQNNREQTLKERREQLMKRADELDREIRKHVEDIRAMIRRMDQQQAGLDQWASLQDERVEALGSLAEIERESHSSGRPGAEPGSVEFVPARVELAESRDRRTIRALLVGFGSLLVCLLGWLSIHGYQTWRHNRQAIEAATRELQAAARK